MKFRFAALALGSCCALGNQAVRAQSAQAVDTSELVTLFSQMCMDSFATDAALEGAVARMGGVVMAPSEVAGYLHDDPGEAWYITTSVTLYAVTLEKPPFHTCAIRRMTPVGENGEAAKKLAAIERAYAGSTGGKLVNLPSRQTSIPNGPDVLSFGFGVIDAAGKPSDVFGIFLSNYHGRVPTKWMAYGLPGVGVEERLSRQIIGR